MALEALKEHCRSLDLSGTGFLEFNLFRSVMQSIVPIEPFMQLVLDSYCTHIDYSAFADWLFKLETSDSVCKLEPALKPPMLQQRIDIAKKTMDHVLTLSSELKDHLNYMQNNSASDPARLQDEVSFLRSSLEQQHALSHEVDQLRRDSLAKHIHRSLKFKHACRMGDIGWVKLGALRQIALTNVGLPRRQELEHDLLIRGAPPHGLQRWVISHPWLAKQHADFHGEHLKEIVVKLDQCGANENDVVFFDFWSMYQRALDGEDDRTPEQYQCFKVALRMLNDLYASEFCKVVVIASIPSSARQEPFVLRGTNILIEPNSTPYIDRGWCFFELLVSLLFQTCEVGVLDEACLNSVKELVTNLYRSDSISFTNGVDKDVVVKMLLDSLLKPNLYRSAEATESMRLILKNGNVRLLRVSYLRKLARNKGVLRRRQDLSVEAFECQHIASEALGIRNMFTLSYFWESKAHPDPSGFRVQDVVRKLDDLEAHDDDLLFWDWASLHQNPKSPDEEQMFKEALKYMNLWFASSCCRTLVSTAMRDDAVDIRGYFQRGWTLFELTLSAFTGNVIFDEAATCDAFIDIFFAPALEKKVFTCGKEDRELVSRLFKQLLYERAGIEQTIA